MKESGDLHKSLWHWADHLNQIGNEGAHPEDYDEAEEAAATAGAADPALYGGLDGRLVNGGDPLSGS